MIKKLLTYSVVVTTMVWSIGLLATPLAVGAAVSGDLIKLQCAAGAGVNDPCKAVYYLGADGKRYVFPNEKTYNTWYSDFLGVEIVSDTEMSSYTIGGNVTYRPGVKLVKITTDPKVYAVADNGTLMWVTTGALAESLYGSAWASMVEDVPDAFFTNYSVGSDVNAAGDFDKQAQMDGSPNINDDKNLSTDGNGVSTGTGLTVALAADTPATNLFVGNSINNKFTKVDLTASADGDIIIDQIVVRRGGTVASDAAFSSVALIDVATNKRIGNTKTINSEHKAVFNKDITVAAGTTKSIYLVGNFGSLGAYAGEIPTLDLFAMTLTGTAAVIGTLPIVGNFHEFNGTITIGTLTLANGANNPDAGTQKIGTTNYIVSGFKLTASSAEDFEITQISFDQGGTASDNDVGNLDLLVDDVPVATVSASNSGDVFFDLSADPITIAKGKTKDFDLRVDILDGSDRTIRFDIKDESDIIAMGQLYGAEVKLAAGTGATADAEPFWTAVVTTIDKGALRIGPASLSAENIPEDVDQIVLGKFEFEAKGEAIDITSLPIAFIITTSTGSLLTDSTIDLTNVTVYDENGVIVAGPIDPTDKVALGTAAGAGRLLVATSTDTITVPSGIHEYTIKADLDADFGTGDTIVVRINPGQVTAKGETTSLSTTPTPSSDQTSATMTVQSAQLALSALPTPIAQTIVAGTDQHTFANILLGAESSGEDVKVTKIIVRVECDGSCNPAEVSNWSIYDGSTRLSVTNDPSSQTGDKNTDDDEATSTFTFSTPLVIIKGTSKTLTIKGDISTSATDGTMKVGMSDGTSASSHITAKGDRTSLTAAITLSKNDGQGMTFIDTGTLTIIQNASTPKAGYIPANSTGITIAILDAKARFEDIKIEKLFITGVAVNSGGWDQVSMLHIYNGSTLIKSVQPSSTDGTAKTTLIDMTFDPIVVPKDTTVTLTLKVDTPVLDYEINGDGSGIASSLEGIQLSINASGDVTGKGAESGNVLTTSQITVTGANGNNHYLVRSVPTIVISEDGGAFPALTSTKVISSFTVTADSAADIGLFSVSYELSTSTATVTDTFLYVGTTKVATASTTEITANAGGSGWVGLLTFILTTDGALPTAESTDNSLPIQSVIKAGESTTYTFKGKIECGFGCTGSTNTGTIIAKFLGDGSAVGTSPVTTTQVTDGALYLYENSILWTDWWRTPDGRSSTTATITEQWINGYLVKDNSDPPANLAPTSSGAVWSKTAQ